MKKILLSILMLVIGVASSYGQCPASASYTKDTTGTGGITATGAYDDMAPVTTASGGNVVKGYFGLNWYPTPDSVQSPPPQSAYPLTTGANGSQWFSYEIYNLHRIQVAGDWKMQVIATNADSNFSTFGIGFPNSNNASGIDLSNNATMSIDVDNSQNVTKNGTPIPLYFTANLTDVYGTILQYMSDTTTNYNRFIGNYDNSYKAKFTDTISASQTTVSTSLSIGGSKDGTPGLAWPGNGQSKWSTSSNATTVNFDFSGAYNIVVYGSGATKADSFPCTANPTAGVTGSFAWNCPTLSRGGQDDFDFTQVVSIAFYFNGGGNTHDNVNPDPKYVAQTGVAYPGFTGTVLLDNFKIGTANSPTVSACCWQYNGCVPGTFTGTTNAVNMVPKALLIPNPASTGQAMINDPSGASSYNITVTNTVGSVILTTTGASFNVPPIPGMYFVTYSTGQGVPTTLPLIVK